MRRILLAAIIVTLVSLPFLAVTPVSAQTQGKALILSSLERLVPMGYYGNFIKYELTRAGYQVTFLADAAVTLDFLTTQLNNYDVIIWRTNLYTFKHQTYWYVGEMVNSATRNKYATDFAQHLVDSNAGILGVSTDFFSNHFSSGSLQNVKLIVLVSSASEQFANSLINAGVKAVISYGGVITLTWGKIDDVTGALIYYLTSGDDVQVSVNTTIGRFSNATLTDPFLDAPYTPPLGVSGDGTLKIT